MEYKGRAERNQGGGSGTDLVRESLAVMRGVDLRSALEREVVGFAGELDLY